MERKNNDQVLTEVNENMILLNVIGRRKAKWIEHLIGHDRFLTKIFEGTVLHKKPRAALCQKSDGLHII